MGGGNKTLLYLSVIHKLDRKLLSKGYKKGSDMKPALGYASIMKQDLLAAVASNRKGVFVTWAGIAAPPFLSSAPSPSSGAAGSSACGKKDKNANCEA